MTAWEENAHAQQDRREKKKKKVKHRLLLHGFLSPCALEASFYSRLPGLLSNQNGNVPQLLKPKTQLCFSPPMEREEGRGELESTLLRSFKMTKALCPSLSMPRNPALHHTCMFPLGCKQKAGNSLNVHSQEAQLKK